MSQPQHTHKHLKRNKCSKLYVTRFTVVCYTATADSYTSSSSGWSKEEGRYESKRKALSLCWWNVESQRSKLRRLGANLLILSSFLSLINGEGKRHSVDFGKPENIRNISGPFFWVSMGEAVSLQKTPAFYLPLCQGPVVQLGQGEVSGLAAMALSASGFPQSLESLWGV